MSSITCTLHVVWHSGDAVNTARSLWRSRPLVVFTPSSWSQVRCPLTGGANTALVCPEPMMTGRGIWIFPHLAASPPPHSFPLPH